MADPYECMELEGYNRGPDPQMRSKRLKMEEELLIRLGVKKEMIELHPLILSSRLERAKTFTDLQYSRAIPPSTERCYVSRNSWNYTDQALRQMSNPSRRGPRDFVLPNLVKTPSNVKVESVPDADHDFFARREVILDRLNKLLDEWAVYERRAFPPLINRLSTLKELVPIKPVKELTKANLKSLGPDRGQRKSFYSWSTSSNHSSSHQGKKTKRRAEHRKRTRWSRMAQEALLQMKASHIRMPVVPPRSELRVYVSSTPDLHEEREFLEEVAYPKLKELCENIGLNCHFVDMRKGSGFLSNDVETFDLIDKELLNCRELSIGPHFVSLLGHELDDQKLPGFLERAVYEKIRETLIREHIIGVEMFDEAYRLDSNRVPGVYIKQPLRAINEYQGPEYVEQVLLTALNSALSHMKVKDGGTEDFYKWSAVVREVEGGLLRSHNPKRETLCFMFDDDPAPEPDQEPDLSNPVERLRHNVITHYGRTASKASLMKFKSGRKTITYLRSLADTFIASMASMLKAQVRHSEYDVTQQMTEGSEALQHVRVALTEADVVADNSKLLEQVQAILEPEDESPKTVLLVGPCGSGKTTLASQIAKQSLLWDPRRKIVFRCLGMTLRSSSLFRTLESLIKQLNFLYSLDNNLPSDSNLNGAISTFCQTLQLISDSRKGRGNLLLVLDHLERFRDVDIHVLLKIINSIHDGISLVLSIDVNHPFTAVLESHPVVQTVSMVPFNKVEINDFMKKKLTLSKRRVTQDQMKTVMRSIASDPIPVYFEMIFNIIKCWPSHTLPELQKFSGVADLDFLVYLDILEKELGPTFTRYALSLLVASRHGLADSELVHLLAEDGELLNEIKAEQDETVSVVEGFSYQLQISRLISLLGKFVVELKIEGETVLKLTCKSLNQCIQDKYLRRDFFYAIHNRLATFFLFIRRGMLLSSKDISEKRFQDLSKYQWRMMRSVPYHLCFTSSDPDQVWATLKEKVFFNFSWLVNEIYSGFYIDLMDDIRFALEHVDLDPDIQYLQQFLMSTYHTAIHNPLSLASVFACQNIQETDDQVKDSVRDVVREARLWLKQVHTQALIPVEYTMDKITRLLIKKNCLRMVTDMWTDNTSKNLILRRDKSLFLSNMMTGEETPLVEFKNEIKLVYLDSNKNIFVSTIDSDHNVQFDVFDLEKGNCVYSMPLNRQDVKWVDFRSTSEIYSANDEGIHLVNVEETKASNIWAQKKPWVDSYVTQGQLPRIVTVSMEEKMKIQILTLKTLSLRTISFKKPNLNTHCKPLISTKDGKYMVIVFEREASVIDLIKSEETETFSHKGLPIIGAELSRSHEHIFFAYMNGSISCHVLYSGNTSMITQINSRVSQSKDSSKPNIENVESRDQNSPMRTPSPSKQHSPKRRHFEFKNEIETITSMITSEDDHFLFCGTNTGYIYGIHVPTGHQVVAILTPHRPIKKILYLTNRENFQHLITLNEDGLALHWNLRPLLKQARALVKPYIIDEDLLKEEQTKGQLRQYYKNYATRYSDRVFLNGPDIAAFYKDPPQNMFISLEKLDPAFKPVTDWEKTGTFADCIERVKVFACGKELGDILLTISNDMRLARWSLYEGRLVWCKRLTFGYGNIQNAALVYFDQALMITEKNIQDSRLSVTVVYLGDGQTKILTRHDVVGYWTSQDRCQVLILCQDQGDNDELSFYHWDLINASEEERRYSEMMFEDSLTRDSLLFTTISPALNQVLRLSLVDKHKPEEKNAKEETAVADDVSLKLERTPGTFPEMALRKGLMGMEGRFSSTLSGSFNPVDNLPSFHVSTSPRLDGENKDPVPTKHVRFQSSNQIIAYKTEDSANALSDTEKDENTALSEAFDMNIMLTWNLLGPKEDDTDLNESKPVDNNGLRGDSPLHDSSSGLKSAGNKPATSDDTCDKAQPPPDQAEGDKETADGPPMEVRGARENSDLEDKDTQQADKLRKNWCFLKLDLSAICFTGEDSVLTGTMTGHVMLLNIPTFHIACVLTIDGPRLLPVDTLDHSLTNVTSPHRGPITYVGTSDDGAILISAGARTVCLWNNLNRLLVMVIQFDVGQELTHMITSRDAAVVAIVTNHRVIHVWTSVGSPREIASYMTTFDILDLGMSSDCHKVVVRGKGHENDTLLEIFELKNIDDVLMHVPSRKQSNDEGRKSSTTPSKSQASRRRMSRQLSERRRSSSGKANPSSHS